MNRKNPLTLTIDIGGSAIKMMVIDSNGLSQSPRKKEPTPQLATPANMIALMLAMMSNIGKFDRLSVGFPGVIKKGVVMTAFNLDKSWIGYNLEQALGDLSKKPVLVANDADIQGYASITGKGLEIVLTLGTGMGSALFVDGVLAPNLELGHHPLRKKRSYEQLLGQAALAKHGLEKWEKNLRQAVYQILTTFNCDALFIGGGNARHVDKEWLPEKVYISDNIAGLLGGIRLWQIHEQPQKNLRPS